MAKRVLLGKEGSNYVLKVSKPSVDVIDDTINDRDYLFNSEMYRAGVIRSNSTYTYNYNFRCRFTNYFRF